MDLIINHRNWDEIKAKLKNKFPQLIESDFLQNNEMENNMLRIVEYKLGKTKEQMRKIIADLK